MRQVLLSGMVGLCVAALGTQAAEAADNAAFEVGATVVNSCEITADDLNFGDYTRLADSSATTTLQVECNEGTEYSVTLSAGTNAEGAQRRMKAENLTDKYLNYKLTWDDQGANNWTETEYPDLAAFAGATAGQDVITVYGTVAGGQTVPSDDYSDSVTATITYDAPTG